MDIDWQAVLEGPDYEWERRNSPATDSDLADLAKYWHVPLPKDYVAFLRLSNGAALWYRDVWYMRLWSAQDIPSWSSAYGLTPEKIPGVGVFGDDGGDESLVFDLRGGAWVNSVPVYAMNFISPKWIEAIHVADDFRDLMLSKDSLLHEVERNDP